MSADGSTSGDVPGSTSGADGSTGMPPGDGSTDGGESSGGGEGDTTGGPEAGCEGNGGLTPEELLANVDTIVVVMMENRSFDHYFGAATFREDWSINGLTGDETNPRLDGTPVQVFNLDNLTPEDPPHSWGSVHEQWNAGAMDGFVREHEMSHPGSYDEVMGYHVRGQLPVLYALADNYVVCDNWFSSVLGPTWPNRFYMHCATSGGLQSNLPNPGLPSIWNVLGDAGVSGLNYFSDVPWAWGAFTNPLLSYTQTIGNFFDAAAAGTLPSFVIVDPNFGLLPGGEGGNDDHPSHDITLGQIFLGSVYQALAQSPQWESCLLIITYDEHGGFYDHAPPPEFVDSNPAFAQLGIRVPSVVVGPHVRQGCVDNTLYDHVSPLATATRRFGLAWINDRAEQTADVSNAIDSAYLDDPQPPARIPLLSVSVEEVLRKTGTSQHEMASMIQSGTIPLPRDRRDPGASRRVALEMLEHAQRLGVVELKP